MKHIYVEFGDGTLVTFNDIVQDKNGEHIEMYFEKPTDDGFAYLQLSLPDLSVTDSGGLSDKDIEDLKHFAGDNAALIWEKARKGA